MELENKAKRGVDDDGDGEDWGQLLEDLLFEEVLPRLPVRYLIRLKLVSKKWLHRITKDSHFIRNHLRRRSQAAELSIILAWSTQLPSKRVFIVNRRTNKARLIESLVYTERVAGDFSGHRVIGSCDGLVCISLWIPVYEQQPPHNNYREVVVLWNPETGEARDTVVPLLPCSFYDQWKGCFVYPAYGVGPDERHGDYKVVRVSLSQSWTLNFDVFSINSGVWRRLEKGLCGYTVSHESREPVLVNGCLYWLVLELGVGFSTVRHRSVLSFDLRDDKFRIVRIFKDDMINSNPYSSPCPSRLIKWKGNCVAYVSSDAWIGNRRHFTVKAIVNNNGIVVNDTSTSSSTSVSIPWQFEGFSHGQFFVAEANERFSPLNRMKLVMYGIRREVLSTWCFDFSTVHDYIPSLVSVYPNRETMTEETEENKRMEVRCWTRMFWKTLGYCR